jgi:hypothetical protein
MKKENQIRQRNQESIKNVVACIEYWLQRFFNILWCWYTVCVNNLPVDPYSWSAINWVIYFILDELYTWNFASIYHISDGWSWIVSSIAVPLWHPLIDLGRVGESSLIFIIDDLPSSYDIIVTGRTWKIWWSDSIAWQSVVYYRLCFLVTAISVIIIIEEKWLDMASYIGCKVAVPLFEMENVNIVPLSTRFTNLQAIWKLCFSDQTERQSSLSEWY